MKKIFITLLFILTCVSLAYCANGETYVNCTIQTVIRLPEIVSEPMEIKRYFYFNNATKKVYDKNHRLIISEYEKGILTIHLRQEDRTERIIYNTQTKSATLFGKQRRGYYYPWVGYNGQGNCSTVYKK